MSGDGRPTRRHDLWDDEEPTGSESTAPQEPTPPEAKGGAPEADARTRRSRRDSDDDEAKKRPAWLIPLAAVLALALCGGGAFAALGGSDATDSACGGTAITVAATPEIAGPLEEALAKVKDEDECAEFDVTSTSAADAARGINDGQAPDVWIPDSSTWIDAIDPSKTKGQWIQGQSIAVSPVVLASGADQAKKVTKFQSWGTLLNQDGGLRMANPDSDTASRLAFHASRIGQPDRIGLETGERLIFMSRFAAPSLNKLFADYTADQKKTQPFPASEQQIAQYNKDNPDVTPLRAVMPAKGTLSLDYPWIMNPELSGDVLKTADSARTELGTLEMRDALTTAGFRTSNGSGGPEVAGEPAPELVEMEPLDRNERVAAVDQWDKMRTDMRMLAVIDASGSMEFASPTAGMTRWDVTKGSLSKGASILPAGSQVGAWIFSTDQSKGRDYRELSPVKRLDSKDGSGSHRERLLKLIEDGDKYLGGDTGLYDSIWAAHQKMVKEYDADYVNSIVVFTDGENDDPNGGLSLNQLLQKLDDAYDPKKPVRIITIGMGEADPTALQKISDESGGTSYIAETPDDIERVFVQALLARSGR
ncbi:substrate-binding domain-containing protein [Janibacter limosus]|uniref:substrate-binding domain-containing protein n=1 Tax=Janibacter limosus TaxID=53458 RepID=UPI00082DC967|nr:substrate-binding domain-containing protein [Janibacter limosus]